MGLPDAVGLGDDAVALRLENLEALTDATLTRLDVDDLLVELLGRVREILDVDTASVLMLDAGSSVLVARAACGIEDEVRQGVRIPVGIGFAGHIAATREPARLDRVDGTTVVNPVLSESGIKVMLGVPPLSGDDVLGVIYVGRLSDRAFDDEDMHLLQVVADRIVGVTQARALAIERAATRLLERSLVALSLPIGASRWSSGASSAVLAAARRSTTITLAPGSVAAFYTDGLIERRGESIDVGLECLCDVTSPGPPERVAAEMMRHLVGNTITTDDIALVVIGRSPSN